jgi:hypothetical protein
MASGGTAIRRDSGEAQRDETKVRIDPAAPRLRAVVGPLHIHQAGRRSGRVCEKQADTVLETGGVGSQTRCVLGEHPRVICCIVGLRSPVSPRYPPRQRFRPASQSMQSGRMATPLANGAVVNVLVIDPIAKIVLDAGAARIRGGIYPLCDCFSRLAS